MRYTKDLQAAVLRDIDDGLTIEQCSNKYDIPESIIIRWGRLDYSLEHAREVTMHKYSPLITDCEAGITSDTAVICEDVSDCEWNKFCTKVFKHVFDVVARVVQSERKNDGSMFSEKEAEYHKHFYDNYIKKNRSEIEAALDTGCFFFNAF